MSEEWSVEDYKIKNTPKGESCTNLSKMQKRTFIGANYNVNKKRTTTIASQESNLENSFLMPPNLLASSGVSMNGLIPLTNFRNTMKVRNDERRNLMHIPVYSDYTNNKENVQIEENEEEVNENMSNFKLMPYRDEEQEENVDFEEVSIDEVLEDNNNKVLEDEWHPCCRQIYKMLQTQGQAIKVLTDNISHVRGSINVLNELLINRDNGEIRKERNNCNLLPTFPFQTVEDFEDFDLLLNESQEVKKQFEEFLLSIGGKKFHKIIRNALNATLSNEVGCSYNWVGTRGAKKMSNTAFSSVFLSTFNNKKGGTKHEIEEIFKDWLRRSSDRKNNERNKKTADYA